MSNEINGQFSNSAYVLCDIVLRSRGVSQTLKHFLHLVTISKLIILVYSY
jgi:hypothetical protein